MNQTWTRTEKLASNLVRKMQVCKNSVLFTIGYMLKGREEY